MFFVQSVSKGKSEQKSADTEVTDQTCNTDNRDNDFIEDDNWEKETKKRWRRSRVYSKKD